MICQGVRLCVWLVLLITSNLRLARVKLRSIALRRKGMPLNPRRVTPHCLMPEQHATQLAGFRRFLLEGRRADQLLGSGCLN